MAIDIDGWLSSLLELAIEAGLKCASCDHIVETVIHCKACGWTRRFCHRCKAENGAHFKRLHRAICEPIAATN